MTDERDFAFTLQRDYAHVTRVVQPSATVAGIHLRVIVSGNVTAGRQFSDEDLRFGATTDGDVGVASNGGIKSPEKAAEAILSHLF